MEKMRQIPLGGLEPDEEIGEEAVRVAVEEKEVQSERERIEQAMTEEGFISYEKIKEQRKEGPGRKAARTLLEELRGKEDEKKKEKKKTLF